MHSDEETLAEPVSPLLAEALDPDGATDLARVAVTAGQPRERVLALRTLASRPDGAAPWAAALTDEVAEVRHNALRLLARRERDDELVALVTARLADEDALVAEAATHLLGEWRCSSAASELVRLLGEHEDARVREAAVVALGELGEPATVAHIIAALGDKAPIRRRAIVALANFEGPDVDAALATAREDRDWQVRAAVDQLGRELA